jgi:hypothetical protein
MTTTVPLFQGEAMLLSWGDTSSRGKTVTFALHPAECGEAHPFRDLGTGKHGQRFQIVAVPIGDDDQPLSPEALDQTTAHSVATGSTPAHPKQPVASGETKERRKFADLPLPQQVALRCADEGFRQWIAWEERALLTEVDDEFAARWVRQKCDVHSRADIKPGSLAEVAWKKIEARFLADNRPLPEERG